MKFSFLATSIVMIGMANASLAQEKGAMDPDWQKNMQEQAQAARAKYEALPTLEMKMDALRDMNSAIGSHQQKVNKVTDYMETYLKDQDLWSEYNVPDIKKRFGDRNKDGVIDMMDLQFKIDFDEALDIAVQHQGEIEPHGLPESPDQRRVTAYEDVVRKSWVNLNNSMAKVQDMSEFLVSKGDFQAFVDWAWERYNRLQDERQAKFDEKSRQAVDDEANRVANSKQMLADRKQQMAEERNERIKFAWEQHKFNTEQETERYKYAMKYKNGGWNGYSGWGWGGGWRW